MATFGVRKSGGGSKLRDGDSLRSASSGASEENGGSGGAGGGVGGSDTFPGRIVEVGFSGPSVEYLHLSDSARGKLGTGKLAPAAIFTDVSAYALSGSIHRGANRVEGPVVRYEAGTSTTVLNNVDRRFDPTNLDGPYVAAGVTQVVPMIAVRHRATWNDVTYDLWRGFADNWDLSYMLHGRHSEVTLTATDAFKVFEAANRAASGGVGSGEDSGARITRILDSADWPTDDRIIATGDSTVRITTLEGSALAELLLVTDSEIGEIYVDGAGRVIFRNRHAVVEDSRSNASQATFGDDGGSELPYQDVTIEYDHEQLVNRARITRENGVEQTAEDTTSQSKYLVHVYERSGLLMQTDVEALDYGRFIVRLAKDGELRFATITIHPKRDPDRLWPQVLGREIGDRITVKLRPPGGGAVISRDVFIRGIAHDYTSDTWVTTWTLQSATNYSFFVLGHATLGKLGENALSY